MSSPLIASMYWACAEPLCLASELAGARDLPATDVLTRRIAGLFEDMARRCRAAAIGEDDINEARYAIAAFVDEQILRSDWPGRTQWLRQPLQLIYYNENTAGEGFFRRMAILQSQRSRAHVLQIYYLCLCLGFQGQYAGSGSHGLAPIVEQLALVVGAAAGSGEVISPHGAPPDRGAGRTRKERPLVALGFSCLILAVVAFFLLKIAITAFAWNVSRDLEKAAPAHASRL